MLWESADPRQELTRRFGFRDGACAAEWVADVLERYWGLDVVRCDRLVISGRNVMAWVLAGGRRFIAKWSSLPHRFAHLEDAARVVAWLATHLASRSENLRAGQVVMTGSVMKTVFPMEDAVYGFSLNGIGNISVDVK